MSSNRKMHKEEVVHVNNGVLATENNETVPFAPPYKDLEITTQTEVRKKLKDRYPMASLLGVTSKLILMNLFPREGRAWIKKTKLRLAKWKGERNV